MRPSARHRRTGRLLQRNVETGAAQGKSSLRRKPRHSDVHIDIARHKRTTGNRVHLAQGQAFSLDQRTALVTGSTAGIGKAIAEAFADSGARVGINGRNRKRVSAVAAKIEGAIEVAQ